MGKAQRRKHRDQCPGGGEIDHQADQTADDIGARQNHLAGTPVPCVHDLRQGMGLGRQLPETPAKGVDKQNHQRAPEAIVQRPRETKLVARTGGGVKGSGPDPGGRHAGGRHAKADGVIGDHIAVDVFVLAPHAQRHQKGQAIKTEQKQQHGEGGKLEHSFLLSYAHTVVTDATKGRNRQVQQPGFPDRQAIADSGPWVVKVMAGK